MELLTSSCLAISWYIALMLESATSHVLHIPLSYRRMQSTVMDEIWKNKNHHSRLLLGLRLSVFTLPRPSKPRETAFAGWFLLALLPLAELAGAVSMPAFSSSVWPMAPRRQHPHIMSLLDPQPVARMAKLNERIGKSGDVYMS
uniref:Putative secreted protein n=1 Tax=Ixodes ricinus TaxID=34613 RepID=A0A6B0UU23_IXORI